METDFQGDWNTELELNWKSMRETWFGVDSDCDGELNCDSQKPNKPWTVSFLTSASHFRSLDYIQNAEQVFLSYLFNATWSHAVRTPFETTLNKEDEKTPQKHWDGTPDWNFISTQGVYLSLV